MKTINKIKQSETVFIKRSLIKFSPYNPRKEDKELIKKLKDNFKRIGFLGGICWNETTGNLVGGHKRLQTLDLIYSYDGTKEKDYEVKVEKVKLTIKEEKEQNIFLNNKNVQGENDLEKMAFLLPDIDIKFAAIEQKDIDLIKFQVPDFNFGTNEEIKEDIKKIKLTKEQGIELKKKNKTDATKNQQNLFLTITFKSGEERNELMEYLNINSDIKFITSKQFIAKIKELNE